MMRKPLLFSALLLLSAGRLPAAKSIEREMVCPICGRDYYAVLDMPDPQYEMRLDMKPLGAIPGPWRLPDCPGCGFVIYDTVKITKAELAGYKAFVESDDYKRSAERSSYYRAGVLARRFGGSDFFLAHSFLKASWQEEADQARLKEDLELSLKHFSVCASTCVEGEQENSQLMMGELLRRLGRFDEAKSHMAGLRALKSFQGNFYSDILDFQTGLCDKKDLFVHDMEEVKASKMPLVSRLKRRAKKSGAAFLRSLGFK